MGAGVASVDIPLTIHRIDKIEMTRRGQSLAWLSIIFGIESGVEIPKSLDSKYFLRARTMISLKKGSIDPGVSVEILKDDVQYRHHLDTSPNSRLRFWW